MTSGVEMSQEENNDRRSQAEALASSSPDDNTILMRMLRMLNEAGRAPISGGFAIFLSGLIMLVYVVAKWGVPAILAGQTLILQWKANETEQVVADRQIQQQQVTATRDVLTAISGLGDKIDMQGTKIDEQGRKLDDQIKRIDTLSEDVQVLKSNQTATTRAVNDVRARQRDMESVRK